MICHKLVIKSITIEKMLNHWTLDPVDSEEDKEGVISTWTIIPKRHQQKIILHDKNLDQ
jgi:hypothetical protein